MSSAEGLYGSSYEILQASLVQVLSTYGFKEMQFIFWSNRSTFFIPKVELI